MSREDRWVAFCCGVSVAVWAALAWILVDEDLQGVQEAIGWWMIALAFAPGPITALGIVLFAEPGDGTPVSWADEERPQLNARGLESCGGCGG
ncbi:hypothetical protein [Streptomyces sp. NE5-10]|uniref:hypothetical protein n=1 Tax=Streptomyces sp. NE5-10 TaxID=2759674 RepID=UPI001F5B9A45|nr:hypothetical protein [Streptomyces sp. NE5-10]